MVAYSFKNQFVEPISTLAKRQTVRGLRKRHARVGEPIQLYTAMRTRHCRKILARDPICTGVDSIEISFDSDTQAIISTISINGVPLDDDAIEAFALADGFTAGFFLSARQRMGQFWLKAHGSDPFTGVVIRWEPQHG